MTLKQEHTEPFPTGSLGSTALNALSENFQAE